MIGCAVAYHPPIYDLIIQYTENQEAFLKNEENDRVSVGFIPHPGYNKNI